MALYLRALDIFAEDTGSVPRKQNVVAHSYLQQQIQGVLCIFLAYTGTECIYFIHTRKVNTSSIKQPTVGMREYRV